MGKQAMKEIRFFGVQKKTTKMLDPLLWYSLQRHLKVLQGKPYLPVLQGELVNLHNTVQQKCSTLGRFSNFRDNSCSASLSLAVSHFLKD